VRPTDREVVQRLAADAWGAAAGVGLTSEDAELDMPSEKMLGRCKHMGILVHPQTASVRCKACGVKLDPFYILWQYAIQERRFRSTMQESQKQMSDLKRQCDDLTRRVEVLQQRHDTLTRCLRHHAR
jgi:hypothetical protein